MHNDLFYYFFALSGNTFVGDFALFLSYGGSYGLITLMFIYTILFAKNKFKTTGVLFGAIFLSWLGSKLLKIIFQIDRPFLALDIVPLYQETGYSFPSTHAAIFAGAAVAMYGIDKKLGVLLAILALMIGLSRIVIGVHYPYDILMGFAVGGLAGMLARRVFFPRKGTANTDDLLISEKGIK